VCEDGDSGSETSSCVYGTDCEDCGWRSFGPPFLPPSAPLPPAYPVPNLPPSVPPPANPPVYCQLVYGTGTCSEFNYCSNRGTCINGLCECQIGYQGLGCETKVKCSYFDKEAEEWSTKGCQVVNSPPGYTYCECYHLTDFGGLGIPTSAEDLLGDLTGIGFATFSADDIASVLTDFDIAGNPEIFTLLTTCTVLDFVMIVYSLFRRHRRSLRRGRSQSQRRNEARKYAREERRAELKERQAAHKAVNAIEARRSRKLDKSTAEADADLALDDISRPIDTQSTAKKKNPAIQDRVFLDLLDADMYSTSEAVNTVKNRTRKFSKPTLEGRAADYEMDVEPEEEAASVSEPQPTQSQQPTPPLLLGETDRLAPLLELLGPGEALPSVESADVSWAEILQQRMAGTSGPQAGPGLSPGMRMLQRSASGANRTPSGRLGHAPRIPGSSARSSDLGGHRQQRMPRLNDLSSSTQPSAGLPASQSGADVTGTPTLSSDGAGPEAVPGAVASRMRRVASQGALILPRAGDQEEQMAGGLGLNVPLPSVPTPYVSSAARASTVTPPAAAPRCDDFLPAAARFGSRPSSGRSRTGSRPNSASRASGSSRPTTASGIDASVAEQGAMLSLDGVNNSSASEVSFVPETPPPSPPDATPPRSRLDNLPSEDALMQMLQQVDEALGSTPPDTPAGSPRLQRITPAGSPRLPQVTPPDTNEGVACAAIRMTGTPIQHTRLRMMHTPSGAHARTEVDGERTRTSVESPLKKTSVVKVWAHASKGLPTAEQAAGSTENKLKAWRMKPKTDGAVYMVSLDKKAGERLGVELAEGKEGVMVKIIHKESILQGHVEEGDEILSVNGDDISLTAAHRLDGRRVTPMVMVAKIVEISTELELRVRKNPKNRTAGESIATLKAVSKLVALNKLKATGSTGQEGDDQALRKLAEAIRKPPPGSPPSKLAQLSTRVSGSERASKIRNSVATLTTKQGWADAAFGGNKKAKSFCFRFWTIARSEHTLANAIAPPEEDILGDSLQDEQVIHIFWSTMLAELATIFLFSDSKSKSAFPIVQIALLGFMTALICSILAKLMKDLFKFCNKKRRHMSRYDRYMERRAYAKHSKQFRIPKSFTERMSDCVRAIPACLVATPGFLVWAANPCNVIRKLKQRVAQARYRERQQYRTKHLGAMEMPDHLKRLQEEAIQREKSATKLQAIQRRNTARRELSKQRDAAIIMQRSARRHFGQNTRKNAVTEDAAIKVQAVARRRSSNAKLQRVQSSKDIRNAQAEEEASKVMQASARRRLARSEATQKRLNAREEAAAAVKLQAIQRRRTAAAAVDDKRRALASHRAVATPPPSPPEVDPGDATPKKRITFAEGPVPAAVKVTPAKAAASSNTLLLSIFGSDDREEGSTAGLPSTSDRSNINLDVVTSPVVGAPVVGAVEAPEASAESAPKGRQLGHSWQKSQAVMAMQRVKLSAEQGARLKRTKLIPFSRRYIMFRWTLGWAINMSIFIVLWLVCFIYGVTFGPLAFQQVMYAWIAALVQTWLIVEPSEVLALVAFPHIANHPWVVWWRLQMKDLGFV